MKIIVSLAKSLWDDESGVTAVEYGLIAGLMAALLVGVMTVFSGQLTRLFEAISTEIGNAADNISDPKPK